MVNGGWIGLLYNADGDILCNTERAPLAAQLAMGVLLAPLAVHVCAHSGIGK
ncbi:MAG TPA: hypothetical protein VEF35_06710 [Candidatus Bathyarchaeia archaeon]|nr:hypothetical protein [Candidatus Bathyarchaeia archaeon]